MRNELLKWVFIGIIAIGTFGAALVCAAGPYDGEQVVITGKTAILPATSKKEIPVSGTSQQVFLGRYPDMIVTYNPESKVPFRTPKGDIINVPARQLGIKNPGEKIFFRAAGIPVYISSGHIGKRIGDASGDEVFVEFVDYKGWIDKEFAVKPNRIEEKDGWTIVEYGKDKRVVKVLTDTIKSAKKGWYSSFLKFKLFD